MIVHKPHATCWLCLWVSWINTWILCPHKFCLLCSQVDSNLQLNMFLAIVYLKHKFLSTSEIYVYFKKRIFCSSKIIFWNCKYSIFIKCEAYLDFFRSSKTFFIAWKSSFIAPAVTISYRHIIFDTMNPSNHRHGGFDKFSITLFLLPILSQLIKMIHCAFNPIRPIHSLRESDAGWQTDHMWIANIYQVVNWLYVIHMCVYFVDWMEKPRALRQNLDAFLFNANVCLKINLGLQNVFWQYIEYFIVF